MSSSVRRDQSAQRMPCKKTPTEMWMNEVAYQGSTLIKTVVACCHLRRAEVASVVQKGTVPRVRSCLKLIFQETSFAAIILSGQADCSFNSA